MDVAHQGGRVPSAIAASFAGTATISNHRSQDARSGQHTGGARVDQERCKKTSNASYTLRNAARYESGVSCELVVGLLTPLEPQSRFGDEVLEIRVDCPQNGTAV